MPHWKNLQCKPFGKESPTRRDTTVMTAHINIDEEICGEDSTLLFKDHPHSDVKGGSISGNDTTVMTAHINIDEEICGEDSTLLFKDHPHSDVKGGSISRNEHCVESKEEGYIQARGILPSQSKHQGIQHDSKTNTETNNQIVQLNYLKDNPSSFKNAQEVKRNPKSDKKTDSIFLYQVLNEIGAHDNYRRICEGACITSEIIGTFLGVCTQYAIGDAWEGTVTPGVKSDHDAIICEDDFAVIDDISKAHQNEVSLVVVRESDTPSGYVKLQLLDRSKPKENTYRPDFDNEFKSLLQEDKFGRTFLTNIINKGTEKLPFTSRPYIWSAATLLNQCNGKEVDAVWCYRCKEWPEEAKEWFSRSRCNGWPTPNTINELKSFGYFFYRKGHPHSLEKHLEWKIYFPLQERELVFNLTDVQHKSYVVLKMINRDIINLECITTYHWKTCLFYVIEENKLDIWRIPLIIHCVRLCVRQMLKWVKCGFCPNYFIPKENLFGGRLDDKLRIISENKLVKILDDRFCCLGLVKASNICDFLDASGFVSPNTYTVYLKSLKAANGMKIVPSLFAQHAFNHYIANNQNTNVIELWRMLVQIQNTNTISQHTKQVTRISLLLLTPLIYTSLASNISAMSIRQPNLQSRDFLLLGSCTYLMVKGGLTGFLKFISVLYSVGCYKECKWFMDFLDESYVKNLLSICVCHVFPSVVNQMENNIIEIEQFSNLCPCISFLPTELLITPDALKYEMYKNCGMSMAVVDSNVYYFFLKFLIRTKLYGDIFSKDGMHEIDQIKDLLSRCNVRHRDVAYNLLSWCLCTVGMTSLALDNIRMSWIEMQTSDFSVSHFYSTKLHAAVSLYKYFVTRMPRTYPYSVPF